MTDLIKRDDAPDEPTKAQIASACLFFDYSFGLMDGLERVAMMHKAHEWLHAWRKEIAVTELFASQGMTCPPCTHNCNQGRDCPTRKK